jgi:hypothetical protein
MKSGSPAAERPVSANRSLTAESSVSRVSGVQIVWSVTLIGMILIGFSRIVIASRRSGPAGFLDALIVVGVVVLIVVGGLLVARRGSIGRATELREIAPDAIIVGTMRTFLLQAAIGRLSPGTILRYSLVITVDSAGLRVWQGRHAQEVWSVAAESIIDISVDKSTHGVRSWDAISILVRDEAQRVSVVQLFIRRIERPWTLVSGKFVHDLADTMRSRWLVPNSTHGTSE